MLTRTWGLTRRRDTRGGAPQNGRAGVQHPEGVSVPNSQEVRLPAVLSGRLLTIPDYQRPFAWREKQLNDLWEDLDLLGTTGTHYAGTLVLRQVKEGDHPKSEQADDGATLSWYEVVDGQQRLTTCLLLLDRIRRRVEVLAERGVENADAVSARIRSDYGMVSIDNALAPRLKLGTELNTFWVEHCLGDHPIVGTMVAGQVRLREAATFFDTRLETYAGDGDAAEFARLKELQRRVTAGLGFLVYEVASSAEVGMIFETLNERGRPLSDLEKTKNYLLYLARTLPDARAEQLAGVINAAWADIFRNLASQSRDADDALLRGHWLATQNPAPREWKQIASIKSRFDRSQYVSGETRVKPEVKAAQDQESAWDALVADIEPYVRSLRDCSFYLSEMFDPQATFDAFVSAEDRDAARRRSAALARSGVVAQFRPLLFAARLAHPSDGGLYTRLVDICERFSARVFVIRQRRLNAGETRLMRLANDLFKGDDPDNVLREIGSLIWQYASDSEVRSTMESTDENWYGRRGHKYFLYEYELSLRNHGQELEPLSEFTSATKEQRTTEHVLPQHPKEDDTCWWEDFTTEQHAGLVHSLGNLVLTYDNSSYGRKCFKDKRGMPLTPLVDPSACYAQAGLKQEQLLAHYDAWTPQTIQERQQVLAEWALERWTVPAPTSNEIAAEEPEIEAEDPDAVEIGPISNDG